MITVGTIKGKTFIKTVLDRHILHSPPGHAIDAKVLEKLAKEGVENVEIKHREKPLVWKAPLNYFMSPEKSFITNRANAGLQKGVYLQYWEVNGNVPQSPTMAKNEPLRSPGSPLKSTPRALQPSLFGGGAEC